MSSNQVECEALALTKMASGHLCLNLSERVPWEAFPAYANALLNAIDGKRARVIDAVDIRLWSVTIAGQSLRLVYDDFPGMISLESEDDLGDAVLQKLYRQLSNS